jgi:uncharacterized protein (DUF1501 family)
MKNSRRDFLRHSCFALGASTLAASLERFGLINALAAPAAQTDYKALVCVFLFGGNDGNNMVMPFETAEYNTYATVRGQTTSGGLGIPLANLLQITAPSHSRRFGLHPNLPEMQTLYNQNKLAVLCNTGTLVQPLTKSQYQAGGPRPQNLFSHDDQQIQWQCSISDQLSRTGWGGRLADATRFLNGTEMFPMITSVAGINLFLTGAQARPLSIPQSGSFGLSGFSSSAAAQARLTAMQQILSYDRGNQLVNAASDTTAQALANSTILNPIINNSASTSAPLFANVTSSIGRQLFQVAKIIEGRATLRLNRQIFFVSLGGFDTHNGQVSTQQSLFTQLSQALKAFYDATAQLGVADKVTTFTLSDFGRTFKPASGGGTDHAWGNHHFILGGAVKGGDFYGQFPALTLGGPSDISNEGRWLPTTSVDQYAATLAQWFGVPPGDLPTVFPNLYRFSTNNVGFML